MLREYSEAVPKLLRFNDLSQPRKVLYRDLVEGAVSDPLEKRLDLSLEKIRSQWNGVPGTRYLDNTELSLT